MSKFRRCASRGALRMAFIDMAMGNGKDSGIDGNKS